MQQRANNEEAGNGNVHYDQSTHQNRRQQHNQRSTSNQDMQSL